MSGSQRENTDIMCLIIFEKNQTLTWAESTKHNLNLTHARLISRDQVGLKICSNDGGCFTLHQTTALELRNVFTKAAFVQTLC